MDHLTQGLGHQVYALRTADIVTSKFHDVLSCGTHEAILLLHPQSPACVGGLWYACFDGGGEDGPLYALLQFVTQDTNGVNTWHLIFTSHEPHLFMGWFMPRTFCDFLQLDESMFQTTETCFIRQLTTINIKDELRSHSNDTTFIELIWDFLAGFCFSHPCTLNLTYTAPFKKNRLVTEWSYLLTVYSDASNIYGLFHNRFKTACPHCLTVANVIDLIFSFVSADLYTLNFRRRYVDLCRYETTLRT